MSRVRRIERLILDAERRLTQANDEIVKISAEIDALKAQLVEAHEASKQLPLPFDQRTRGLSEKWAAVLNFLVLRSPNPVSIDEMLVFAADNDLEITRAAIRAQLYNYAHRGLVERVSDGLYVPTDAARAFCDY